MSDDLNGNARTSDTEFTRTMKTELVGYLEDKVIPVLEDDVIPAVRDFANWFDKEGGPALRDFKDDLDPVVDAVGDLAGFLNDMPGEAKIAALGGLLAGGAALKVRGGRGGVLGTAGSVLGMAKPVPVFVTNPGFGGPNGGSPGGGKPGRSPAGLTPLLGSLGFAGIAGAGTQLSNEYLADTAGSDVAVSMAGPQSQGGGGGLGAPPGFFDFSDDEPKKKAEEVDRYIAKISVFQDALDLAGSTKVHPELAVPGMREATRGIADFIDLQIEAGRPVWAAITLTGIESAMGQLATLNAGLDGLGERGVDNGVPYLHGGSRGANDGLPTNGKGDTYHFHGDMRPADSREFWSDVDKKSRRRGHGSYGG
jgi:hypothetical protein